MLREQLTAQLEAKAPIETTFQSVLDLILKQWNAATGTIHRLNEARTHLDLLAWRGLPESVLSLSRSIPMGKGMAGEAAHSKAPVRTCNLQTDESGVARPGAKATGAQGAIVVPLMNGDAVAGTLGLGMMRSHDFSAEEEAELLGLGRIIGEKLGRLRAG
jgi:putative methionine-R-sulfoxide reductase with GAF domain